VRVEYIPDDAAEIGASVMRLRGRVGDGGFVFTSGGIGPTHDDVTYKAVAAAFGAQHRPLRCLSYNPDVRMQPFASVRIVAPLCLQHDDDDDAMGARQCWLSFVTQS
jgi:hypothetical protein